MSYIIAIDVGIKNLGFVVYDCDDCCVCEWLRVDITNGTKYVPSQNVTYTHDFVKQHANYFAKAHIVLVERQMRVNMRIIESVFHSMFYDRCLIIPAQAVKMHFDISMRNYKQNKRRAVEWVNCHWDTFMPKFVNNLDTWLPIWKKELKQDDLADSMLMTLYYLNTYSKMSLIS